MKSFSLCQTLIVLLLGTLGCRASHSLGGDGFGSPPEILGLEDNTCSVEEALKTAQEMQASATGHVERYVFERLSGIEAHRLFLGAAACFRSAGKYDEAQQSESSARAMAEKVNKDFKYACLLSERMLRSNKVVEAKGALRDVLRFLDEHQEHSFTKSIVLTLGRVELESIVGMGDNE